MKPLPRNLTQHLQRNYRAGDECLAALGWVSLALSLPAKYGRAFSLTGSDCAQKKSAYQSHRELAGAWAYYNLNSSLGSVQGAVGLAEHTIHAAAQSGQDRNGC